MCKVLAGDPLAGVRGEAAIALADAGASEAVGALVDAATSDPAIRVRQMALIALGEVASKDDKPARAALERALGDASPELRFQALIAQCRIDPTAAEPAIYRALGDGDEHVRYVAFRLAEEHWLADPEGVPARLLDAARDALEDENAGVRLVAAILLAKTGDLSGSGAIAAAINDGRGQAEPEDEEAAIVLAGELAIDAARPGLERRAFGVLGLAKGPFEWQARVALARLGDTRARQAILRGLEAWTRDARTMAVAAAGRARLGAARPLIDAMRGRPDRAAPEAVEEALQLLAET
jgi:HEAT repeat protein